MKLKNIAEISAIKGFRHGIYYKGNTKYKSWISGILALPFILLIILYAIYAVISVWK
jgi:hypothetical protein